MHFLTLFHTAWLLLLQFHRAQQEKAVRAHQEATELQQFLRDQVAERKDQKKAEEREDREINGHNRLLMEVCTVVHA